MMKLNLRPVEKEDYETILEWRNDPDVRINSLTQHVISIDENTLYWNEFLDNRKNYASVIVYDAEDIGILKLKYLDDTTSEVDIFLSKNYRNKGLGPQILMIAKENGIEKGIKKLVAKIKYDNMASRKVFEKSGFNPNMIYYEANIK